jgi:hypothetical protein
MAADRYRHRHRFHHGGESVLGRPAVRDILTNNKDCATNAAELLATGGVIWVTNVIAFGLW